LVDDPRGRRDYDLLSAGFDYDPLIVGSKMVIETIVFLVFVVAVGAVVIKVYEWRQDVLYGPYVGRRSERNRYTDRL
jgi:hypothetical protein